MTMTAINGDVGSSRSRREAPLHIVVLPNSHCADCYFYAMTKTTPHGDDDTSKDNGEDVRGY